MDTPGGGEEGLWCSGHPDLVLLRRYLRLAALRQAGGGEEVRPGILGDAGLLPFLP